MKKPLLHDLFDLLGLPVCNTGLSLFTIWSSDRNEDEIEVSSKFCSSRSTKKKTKVSRETSNFLNLCRDERTALGQSSSHINSPSWSRYNPLLVDKYVPRGFRGNNIEERSSTSKWDNGRDWKIPCVKEGGWLRIYPLMRFKANENTEYVRTTLSESPRIVEREIRSTVQCIQRYLKAAKDIQRKNEKLRDEQCNALLQTALDLNTEIWLPEK